MENFLKNKKFWIIAVAVIVAAGIFWYAYILYNAGSSQQLAPTAEGPRELSKQQAIQNQLAALKKLQETTSYRAPTQQQIQERLKNLEQLQTRSHYQSPTPEQIKARMEMEF